jgi:hypothetical protein
LSRAQPQASFKRHAEHSHVAFTANAEKGRPEQEEGTSIAMVAPLSNPFLTKWLWLASRDIEGSSRWRCDACPLVPDHGVTAVEAMCKKRGNPKSARDSGWPRQQEREMLSPAAIDVQAMQGCVVRIRRWWLLNCGTVTQRLFALGLISIVPRGAPGTREDHAQYRHSKQTRRPCHGPSLRSVRG